MKYLHLIRFKNLLLIAFAQLLFRFGFLKLNNVELALTNVHYYLLVLSTILIAAGGFVINSIYNQEEAISNHKKQIVNRFVAENTAYNLYFGLNVVAVSIGYYLSNAIQRPSFLVFFILSATLLYFYSSQLKQIPLLGSIIFAFLTTFCILIIGFFDLFPATDEANKEVMRTYFSILIDYAIMAFLLGLIIEVISDLENFEENKKQDFQTFSVIVGIKKTVYFVAFLCAFAVLLLLMYVNNYVIQNKLYFATLYILFLLVAPLVYVTIRLFYAEIKTDFYHLKTVLKWIIFFGIASIYIISKNIIYNVN